MECARFTVSGPLVGGLLALSLLLACDSGKTARDDASRPHDVDDADGGSTSAPYDIECTGYFSPGTSSVSDTFTVRSDATAHKTLSLAGHAIAFDFEATPEAPSLESTLTVTTSEFATVQRYRLFQQTPPPSFIGDHGFSGLVYIGSQLQYICKASPAAAQVLQESPTPFDIACTVEVRTADGTVERTETFDTDSPEDQTLDLDGFGVRFWHSDTPYDGRDLLLSAWVGSTGDATTGVTQLFQLPREAVLRNPLADGTFFGRTTVGVGSAREATYFCAAR